MKQEEDDKNFTMNKKEVLEIKHVLAVEKNSEYQKIKLKQSPCKQGKCIKRWKIRMKRYENQRTSLGNPMAM